MSYNVAIIGVGSLGARYVQGLASARMKLRIYAVDPSVDAILACAELWQRAGGNESNNTISFHSAIDHLPRSLDLTIVATSSYGRAEIISRIAGTANVTYWIIEKVLAQSEEELYKILEVTSGALGRWVNTPMRQMRWFRDIKNILGDKALVMCSKTGGDWGLACNSIHYIDLFSWLSGEELISIDTTELGPTWMQAKRKGYFEVRGSLRLRYSGGLEAVLISDEEKLQSLIELDSGQGGLIVIDEKSGRAETNDGRCMRGQLELQSQLTAPLVSLLLADGVCELPSLAESVRQHSLFLDAMLKHWNKSNGYNQKRVPIT